MKLIIPLIVLNLICSFLVIILNTSQISSGDEMGAIGEQLISLFYGVIIFVCTIALSIIVYFIIKKNQFYIQLLIHGTGVFLIYYSTYLVCIYREPILEPKETRALKLKNINNTREQVNNILSNSDIYKPNIKILENDKQKIRETIKNFFNKSYHIIKNDSIYKDSIYQLVDSNISALDSIETDSYFKSVYNSVDIDQIMHSPDLTKFLVFVSFNETFTINPGQIESGANSFVLIGIKESKQIKLYRFYFEGYSTVNNPNKESAFYEVFIYLTNHSKYSSRLTPINKKEFWIHDFIFGQQMIDNQRLYGFQIDRGGNTNNTPEALYFQNEIPKPKIRKPIFIINY